jgi:hypothetical protein
MASQQYDLFVELLVTKSNADEDTAFAEAVLARALSDITSGGSTVSSLLSSGVNGKTFTRMVHLGPIETARAAQEAIAIYNDAETEVASTYADFRNLNR